MRSWFAKLARLISRLAVLRRRPRAVLLVLGSLVALPILAFLAAGEWVRHRAEPRVFATFDAVPSRMVAIVPGAHVRPSGAPSTILRDRLETARQLYVRHKVRRILVSGDNRTRFYNESKAMRQWLVAQGVPERHIYSDYAGFRTLDTMVRARAVFRVRDATICTQTFHLHRSVFLARRAGIDAVGMISDLRPYQRGRRDKLREYLARTLAFADSYVLDTDPHFFGPPIPVDGPPQEY